MDYHSLMLVIGLLALAAFAGVLYLSQASVVAELRYCLADAEWQAQELWEQNLALRVEICAAQRLVVIEDRAAQLGMVDAPVAGAYLACAMPRADQATVRRMAAPIVPEAAELGSGFLQDLLARLRMGRQPTPSQLVALDARHR